MIHQKYLAINGNLVFNGTSTLNVIYNDLQPVPFADVQMIFLLFTPRDIYMYLNVVEFLTLFD